VELHVYGPRRRSVEISAGGCGDHRRNLTVQAMLRVCAERWRQLCRLNPDCLDIGRRQWSSDRTSPSTIPMDPDSPESAGGSYHQIEMRASFSSSIWLV
jgi:hypothetical protein